MRRRPECEVLPEELFLAGERVAPGAYRQVGADKVIELKEEDFLPASLDGRVAVYVLVRDSWGAGERLTRRSR